MTSRLDFALKAVPLGLALLLAGCAVGPDYRRPAMELPQHYDEPAADRLNEPNQVQADWWELFRDPVLDALVEKSLANNADLQLAVARVEEADAAMREVGAALFPEIDLNVAGNRSRASSMTAIPMPAGTPVFRDARSASLGTSFELDVWGKLRRASEAARAQALSSRYARDTVRLSLAGLVATNYLALRAYDAELAVTRDSLASLEATLKIVHSRLEGGVSSLLDLRQAEGAVAGMQAQLAALRQQRGIAEHQLALLAGMPGQTVAVAEPGQIPLPPVPPAGLPSTLLEARPDVRQAEEDLVAANAKIGVAKAAFFPTISLTGSVGSESQALADLFTTASSTWSLGLGLAVPILDAGRTAARMDQATARQEQAVATYRKTVQTAFKEVDDALVGLRENATAEEAQATRAEAGRQALQLAQARYQAGYSGYLDVLDAQRSANDAQLSRVAARQARLTAAVELFKALGGGWRDERGAAAAVR